MEYYVDIDLSCRDRVNFRIVLSTNVEPFVYIITMSFKNNILFAVCLLSC